jgi:hypothetical protein
VGFRSVLFGWSIGWWGHYLYLGPIFLSWKLPTVEES